MWCAMTVMWADRRCVDGGGKRDTGNMWSSPYQTAPETAVLSLDARPPGPANLHLSGLDCSCDHPLSFYAISFSRHPDTCHYVPTHWGRVHNASYLIIAGDSLQSGWDWFQNSRIGFKFVIVLAHSKRQQNLGNGSLKLSIESRNVSKSFLHKSYYKAAHWGWINEDGEIGDSRAFAMQLLFQLETHADMDTGDNYRDWFRMHYRCYCDLLLFGSTYIQVSFQRHKKNKGKGRADA